MKYSDFSIAIREMNETRAHIVRVACPEGECEGTFTNPFNKDDLRKKLVADGLCASSREDLKVRGGLKGVGPVKSTDKLREIGESIYRSLFREKVLSHFYASIARLGDEDGLRIRIKIDPKLDQYAELMSLPWEFMYDDVKQEFVNLRHNVVIVRYPEVSSRISRLEIAPPLRILAVASQPSDYRALRLGKEMGDLVKVFENKPIEIKPLPEPTLEALDLEINKGGYHVVHFMGHGDCDPRSGASSLVFEGSDRKGQLVSGAKLRIALGGSIKLVFLNACETARVGDSDPFAAISTELALGGVPAVLAMQFPISDAAAVTFAKRFYTVLALGYAVDQCLAFGRRAISYKTETEVEWGTPVLFMHSSDGLIFRVRQGSEQVSSTAEHVEGATRIIADVAAIDAPGRTGVHLR